MTTLRTFLDNNKIPYLRFNQKVVDGKKITKGDMLPSGWQKLTYEKCMKLNDNRFGKYMNVRWGDSKFMVVDIDESGDWWKEKYPETVKTKSTGKGLPHLIYEKHEDDDHKSSNQGIDGGDLCYLNTFEAWDEEVNGDPTRLEFIPVGGKSKTITTAKGVCVASKETVPTQKSPKVERYLSVRVREDVENLLDIIKNPDLHWDTWFEIIIACRNIHPDLKPQAVEWSEMCKKHTDEHFDEKWTKTKPLVGLGMHTLKKYAIQHNKVAFLQWSNRKLQMTPEYFCDNFMEKFGNDNLVYSKDKRLFIFKNGNWFEDNDKLKLKKTIREISQRDLKAQLKDYEENDPFNSNCKAVHEHLEKIQKRGLVDDIATFIMQNLDDATCNLNEQIKFDIGEEQLYNLHFKNGVLELDTMEFRPRTCNDYVTVENSVNLWDFDLERDEELIKEVEKDFRRVQPEDEQFTLMVELLAYALSGDISITMCMFDIGKDASNGKTTKFLIHSKCFPKLTKCLDRNYFKCDNAKRHKTKIDLLQKPIRLAYIEEIDSKQLEAEELKDAVDGKKQNCEIMYGTNIEGSFQCKFNFLGNREPNIKECEGILRRGMMQTYNSKFTDTVVEDDWNRNLFPKVKNFENKYTDDRYKNAYLHLLLDNYKGNKIHIPKVNTDMFTKHIKANNEDRELEDLFENGGDDDWVSRADIIELTKKKLKEVKIFMKDYYPYCEYNKDKQTNGTRGSYNKIKIKE